MVGNFTHSEHCQTDRLGKYMCISGTGVKISGVMDLVFAGLSSLHLNHRDHCVAFVTCFFV